MYYMYMYKCVYIQRECMYTKTKITHTHTSKEREQVMQTLVHIMGSGPLKKSSINVEWCP